MLRDKNDQSFLQTVNIGHTRYSKICEAFDEQGVEIFHKDIQANINIKRIDPVSAQSDNSDLLQTDNQERD